MTFIWYDIGGIHVTIILQLIFIFLDRAVFSTVSIIISVVVAGVVVVVVTVDALL